MKNKKCKEKNFEELKKRILNNVMSFNDLDNLFKEHGYYGMFSCSLVQKIGDKYEVIYKAVDNYHYDLKVLLVIDANEYTRTLTGILNGEFEKKVTLVVGSNVYKELLNSEFKEGEILNVVVTDFQISDFLKKIKER